MYEGCTGNKVPSLFGKKTRKDGMKIRKVMVNIQYLYTAFSSKFCSFSGTFKLSIRKLPVLTCTQVFPRVSIAVRAIGCAY